MNNLPKIGVLALMLEDYLPLFPGIEAAQASYVQEVLSGLSDIACFEFPGVAKNRAEIESIVKGFNAGDADGIMIMLLTYSQGMYVVHALKDNHLPLALTLVQPEQTVRTDFKEWDYTVNQGIHGSQDNANCMMRAGINCCFYAGNRLEDGFRNFVSDFAAAAMTATRLRGIKIGVIGKLPGMGDVFTDDMSIFRNLGVELQYDSIGTITRYCAQVTEDEVKAQMAVDRENFDVDPTLSDENFAEAERMYLGTKRYLTEHNLAGYTLHYGECGEDGRYKQLPLLAASNLLADGYGYAAEGDSTAAILVAAMNLLCGEANFSEMYMMDFKKKAILMCHQGEGNWHFADPAKKPFLKDRELSEGGLSNPPTLIYQNAPGRAVVLSLTHVSGDKFRLICAPGEIISSDELYYVDMPYLFFRPDSGVAGCVQNWLEAGGTHHEAIVRGDAAERIRLLCRIMNIEFVQV